MIATTEFSMQLKTELDRNGLIVSSMELSPHEDGGIHVTVDGKFCVTNIGLWPSGLMDVEYISLPSEKETCTHREFGTPNEMLTAFVLEVRLAIERANRV